MEPFVSMVHFKNEPADTIVVCCSEGRIRSQVVDFLDHLGVEADLYAVPGGPLALASGVEVFTDSTVAQKRIKFLADAHGTRKVMLIAHGGEDNPEAECAMAVTMYPRVSPTERIKREKDALLQAAKKLSGVVDVPIECWFATVVHDMVQFERVG